ncbi:MAG: DivIVA domain-containing protein [Raoultibacter sp.]|jgi:cell division initiation protein
MAITSSDIQNHTFSIDRKGYDVDEVDVFLERLSSEVDEMNATIAQLEGIADDDKFAGFDSSPSSALTEDEIAEKDEIIAGLQRELEEKKANDNAIAQALIIAQRSADEIIENANQDAAQIRQDAEDEAQRILDKANNEKQRILEEISTLEADREETRGDYQLILKDFIADASKKLSDLGGTVPSASAHARPSHDRPKVAPSHQSPSPQVATYTTPPAKASSMVVPATPRPSRVDKDLSGFGDADDSFEFGDID